jgi:hypothetical protein
MTASKRSSGSCTHRAPPCLRDGSADKPRLPALVEVRDTRGLELPHSHAGASSTSSPSRYAGVKSQPIASTVAALGGSTSFGSSRGSFTWIQSRAGFGVMPWKSKTIANAVTLFLIDSRAFPSPSSAATRPAMSAAVN